MGIRKLSDNCGYTLMELMMAAAVLITISSIAVPGYNRYIASTREKVCIINRQTIMYDYNLHYINEPDAALSEFVNLYYAGEKDLICPGEGTITAAGTGATASLTCSVHHDKITEPNLDLTQKEFP